MTQRTVPVVDTLRTETGKLPPALPVDSLYIPTNVTLSDDRENLIWNSEYRRIRVGPNLLNGFLRIARAADEADSVLGFAQRFGPFHLCRHDLPEAHSTRNLRTREFTRESMCHVRRDKDGRQTEPITVWIELAQVAEAVVAIAVALRSGEVGKPTDWKLLRSASLRPRYRRFKLGEKDLVIGKRRLLEHIEAWLAAADAHPIVVGEFEQGVLQISGGLMAALAMAMLGAVTGTALYEICSGCGQLYSPKRQPSARRNRFCSACKNTERWRLAQQRRRRKKG